MGILKWKMNPLAFFQSLTEKRQAEFKYTEIEFSNIRDSSVIESESSAEYAFSNGMEILYSRTRIL